MFELAREGAVDAQVLDLAGRVVRKLGSGRFTLGPHTLVWDGRDAEGRKVAPGVYFARVGLVGAVATKRIVCVE